MQKGVVHLSALVDSRRINLLQQQQIKVIVVASVQCGEEDLEDDVDDISNSAQVPTNRSYSEEKGRTQCSAQWKRMPPCSCSAPLQHSNNNSAIIVAKQQQLWTTMSPLSHCVRFLRRRSIGIAPRLTMMMISLDSSTSCSPNYCCISSSSSNRTKKATKVFSNCMGNDLPVRL